MKIQANMTHLEKTIKSRLSPSLPDVGINRQEFRAAIKAMVNKIN